MDVDGRTVSQVVDHKAGHAAHRRCTGAPHCTSYATFYMLRTQRSATCKVSHSSLVGTGCLDPEKVCAEEKEWFSVREQASGMYKYDGALWY